LNTRNFQPVKKNPKPPNSVQPRQKVIPKPPLSGFKVKPNLTNYQSLRGKFRWASVEKELCGDLSEKKNQVYNLSHFCIDRHAFGRKKNQVAFFWEGTDGSREVYTFFDLHRLTNRFRNILQGLGIAKGDRVFIFLDRIPELYISFFGTLKFGAVVGPLFSAFGPDAIWDRLHDSEAKVVVTSPELVGRLDEVRAKLPKLEKVILVNKRNRPFELRSHELSYEHLMAQASESYQTPRTKKNDFSIMHYTSGTTGKPKGAAHVHGSIPCQYATAKYVLDLHEDDIYWCTADPGWVTGTSYGMLGPWSNSISILVYEGGFNAEKWYQMIEKYRVTVWYTAPTAIRMLMKSGDALPKRFDLTSLRYIASVGEPLNPEAIVWGKKVLGLAIHDNWWQTETGAIMIANYPIQPIKLGSMGKPFPGVHAAIVDDVGKEMKPGDEGHLALKPPWPSMFRTYWNKEDMYRSKFKHGWYLTGDRAWKDEDGYFWFVGRSDDVINTAGHLVGPFEVESALIEHPAVAEAGVIGKPDEERMEIVKAFVSLKEGYNASGELADEIKKFVRTRLAAHAYPREIEFVNSLPKTRSGKIMRRLLKAKELGLPIGDTSTLEE